MNFDYGDTVIADGSLDDVSNWFRSSGTVMPRAVTATRVYGWLTCPTTNNVTIKKDSLLKAPLLNVSNKNILMCFDIRFIFTGISSDNALLFGKINYKKGYYGV